MTDRYRVAVIGRGLIGSAAARHLGEAGVPTVLVGAGEPVDYASWTGPFASHYDEGRVTRIADRDALWAELAARSIRRYEDIETRSGIAFHEQRGLVMVSEHAATATAHAVARGADARLVTREWVRDTTGIHLAGEQPGDVLFESGPAGLINPRRLVAAQARLAEVAGVDLIDLPATAIERHADRFEVSTAGGSVAAERVLLATGAYGASLVGADLALLRRLATVVMAELGPGEKIPSLIIREPTSPTLSDIYWVPPVRYPDGRTMLKIGGDSEPGVFADSDAELRQWFRQGGSTDEAGVLRAALRSLLPDAVVRSWAQQPCVLTDTPSGRPYIGWIDDGVAVALGGCGASAKSSDELGRLAALLTGAGGWADPVLDPAEFAPRFRGDETLVAHRRG